MCDEGFIWNPSNCECECDKSCDVGEYLDYENCKYRKKLIDKLIAECSENFDEKELHSNEMTYNRTLNAIPLNDYKNICNSCTVYIVLLTIFFIKSLSISSVFIYFHWYFKRGYTETAIY